MTNQKKHKILLLPALVCFLFTSCVKTDVMQTFNDVFDTSGIEVLNAKMASAKTVQDLPTEMLQVSLVVPEKFKKVSPAEIADWYSANIRLSDTEVDLLLRNDSRTYINVINRMASFPPEMGSLTAADFKALKASSLDKYLIRVVEQPDNFYSTDYYSAVMAMQDYLKSAVINPMKSTITIPPGSGEYPAPQVYLLYYKVISLNNIWDMWWTYWSDGTRTKHKGAAGSFPG